MGNIHPARTERPELTDRELSYITLHTHFTRKQVNDFYVRFLTYYPCGYINFDQFSELYSSELKHLYNSRPLLERLFHHIDVDKNGKLSFKEVLFFRAISMPETDGNEKIRWIFFLYDKNQDHQIDECEFISLCQLAYYIHGKSLTNIRLNELKNLFKNYDVDENGKLNCQEFTQLCKNCKDLLELIAPMFNNTQWNFKDDETFKSKTSYELTSERIQFLTKRTKFTREQILNYYQIFRKHCCTGRLSKLDFINFYQKLVKSQSAETYCEFIFRAFDNISTDGFIEFDEYLIAIYIHSNASTPQEKLEWLYNAYDRDGNGYIDYNELNQIVHALFLLYGVDREKCSAGYISYQIMAILDLNNDDKITKQEFINILKDKELTKFLAPSLVKQQS